MQFNKSKFNKGRFNTSESRILFVSVELKGSEKTLSGVVRTAFLQSNIVNQSNVNAKSLRITFGDTGVNSYGDIAAIPTKVMLTGGFIDGISKLESNLIKELLIGGAFSGSSEILATLEVKGIITIKTDITGEGKLAAIPVTVSNIKPEFSGLGSITPLLKRETYFGVDIGGKGNLDIEPIAIKFARPTIDGEGRINIKITKVIFMTANTYGYGDINATLSKMFYISTLLVGYGGMNATVQANAMLKARLMGTGEILVTPYAVYSPPFIILPTKLLIEDITTKAVIL